MVIRLSGEIVERKKKLLNQLCGTSRVLSRDEAKFLLEKGCEQIIFGSGQFGNVHLSPEAEAYFAKHGCKVLLKPQQRGSAHLIGHAARGLGFFTSPAEPGDGLGC